MDHKVGIIGRFGFGKNLLNGQTIKTKTLVNALSSRLGAEKLHLLDTYGGMKMLLRLPFQCAYAMSRCKDLVILPAYKGIRVIAPMLVFLNIFYGRKLHYVVIGGWLCNLLQGKPVLARCLKRFDVIYAETTSMKRNLEALGFRNVVWMPNFKALDVQKTDSREQRDEEHCRLCTFSRVMREKGIETAVKAVKMVNERSGRDLYCLDIYGQVDPAQQKWFAQLQKSFPPFVRYCGEVPFDRSVSVLCRYDALLFPTAFYTEGIPGTVIDAYAAGIPVIASEWENYSDIIDEETGIGYPFGEPEGLSRTLLDLEGNTEKLKTMREACIRKAYDFLPEAGIRVLLSRLDAMDCGEI